MPKKSVILVLIILLTFVLGVYGFRNYSSNVKDEYCLATRISSKVFDFNSFEIVTDSTVDAMDFRIVNQNSGKTIFKNGQYLGGIKNEHGTCSFDLYYRGRLIYEFGHFKFNNWHTNKYVLNVSSSNGELKPSLTIIGPDNKMADLYFKKQLN